MTNFNRLGSLILGLNRQEFRGFNSNDQSFVKTKEVKSFSRTVNDQNGRLFQIFQELLILLNQISLGAVTGILTFLGKVTPKTSQPGQGIIYYDSLANRFEASEDTRAFFDAFPREGCRVANNAAIAITTATVTALTFNTIRFDPFVLFTSGTSQIVFNRAGRYLVGGTIEFAANGVGYRQVAIRLNGTAVLAQQNRLPIGGAVNDSLSLFTEYEFVSGDFVELIVFQNSGGNLNVNSTGNYSPEFYATRVHDQS